MNKNAVRHAILPLYLFACLTLGGSAQGVWANMVLQLGGLALITWSALGHSEQPLAIPARQMLWLALAALSWIAIQLVPLPASLWPSLPGRSQLATDYAILGIARPQLPLSLTPHVSLSSLLALIPPAGMFCAMVRFTDYRPSWLAAALLAGTVAGIVLGTLQVGSGEPTSSPWYLYPASSFGVATGFFANANHMAILMVVSLPFLAALLVEAKSDNKQRYFVLLALSFCTVLVILVGIILNRSLAGYGLAVPVLAASAAIVLPTRSPLRLWTLGAAALLIIGVIGAIASTSVRDALGEEAVTSVQSRAEMLATTDRAVRDFMPFGTGLGSFPSVYKLYEDPNAVTNIYVSHAHNDYLELALELGVPGILLVLGFLIWWCCGVWRVWGNVSTGPYARAASIATGTLLIHSLVDFPMRTAAIGACFAMGVAMLGGRPPAAIHSTDLRPTRHITFP